MSTATDVKLQVDKVINDLGSTILVQTPITVSFDKWGDKTEGAPTFVSIKGVPLRYFPSRLAQRIGGDQKEGDFKLIIKGDEVIGVTDYITWDSVDYNIIETKKIPLQDVILAQSLILNKKI